MKTIKLMGLFSIGSILMLSACDPKKENTTVTLPSNIIPIEKGIVMKQTYKNDIQAIVERHRAQEDYQGTEFAWINLDSLKNYIALLDKVSELNHKKVSGIRIYFSEYPQQGNYNKNQMDRLLPGRETLFLAPTTIIPANENTRTNPILENVPFSISGTRENKLVGEFKVIEGLLGVKERSTTALKMRSTTEKDGTTSETSLLLNDLGMYPPPKQ